MNTVLLSWVDPSTGEPQQRTFALPLTIGRAPDCGLVLDSVVVSAHHAVLRAESVAFAVEDLQSRNGVYLNGTRVRTGKVTAGDTVAIGPFHLAVFLDTADVRVRCDWTDPQTGRPKTIVQRLPVAIGSDPSNAIAVADPRVLPRQVMIQSDGANIVAADASGASTIAVDGTWTARAVLERGVVVQLGAYRIVVTLDSAARRRSVGEATIVFDEVQLSDVGQRLDVRGGAWPPAVFSEQHVPLEALAPLGIPVGECDYVTVGAGLGSFIWVDHLLVRGVRAERIAALGTDPTPYARYRRLCRNSQIPDHERLRSNSESTADNVWGWPGYAAREIWQCTRAGRLGQAAKVLWQIFGEPAVSETYTPIARDVFDGIDREARRIGWDRIVRYGRVRAIRKSTDGRYVIAFSQMYRPDVPPHALMLARHLHLATGYPALQFLPDLQRYREDTGDFRSVVNAYEDHDHIYQQLAERGGVVLLRGRGIVASRILQRIHEVRARQPNVYVFHLHRSPLVNGHRWRRAKRDVDHHFELQAFNWPKSCWGGDLRFLLEQSSPEERKRFLTDWGGTTTARRSDWLEIVRRGEREGWYRVVFGEVERVERTPEGRIATVIRGRGDGAAPQRYDADVIIDATGLEAKAQNNPLVKDLIDHYRLPLNPLQRLDVTRSFEVPGLRNGPGRAFAVGAMTLGGPFAPVDSFLGFQYAAMVSLDALADGGAPGLARLGPWRSFAQWARWATGRTP